MRYFNIDLKLLLSKQICLILWSNQFIHNIQGLLINIAIHYLVCQLNQLSTNI